MANPASYPVRKAGTVPLPDDLKSPFLGGTRPGAGRKRDEVRQKLAGIVPGEPPPQTEDLSDDELVFVDFATARARKESAAAAMAELQFRIKSGEYVPRAAVRSAVSAAMAATAQTLRSIPDNIERKLGVDPELAQEVGHLIDDAMDSLAEELERMARDGF